MNRYNESPEQALKMLNAKPEFDQGTTRYAVELAIAGVPLDSKDLNRNEWKGNPLQNTIQVNYKEYEDGSLETITGEEDWDWGDVNFTPSDLRKIDSQNGKFIFVDVENNILTLTKIKEKTNYYYDAF